MAKQWYEMTPEEINEKVAEQATEDADEAELENIEKAIEIEPGNRCRNVAYRRRTG